MSSRRRVRLLITDLDNTLYDWIAYFVPAFYEMVGVASQILGVSDQQLLDEIKVIHQRYGSTEHPFALLDTSTVARRLSNRSLAERREYLAPAFKAFNSRRKRDLRLYPSVAETLDHISAARMPAVAYTEAAIYNVAQRMRVLGLWSYIQRLYAPCGRTQTTWNFGFSDPVERIRLLPVEHRKPDPGILRTICDDHGISPAEALYIGDSVTKDVAMAKEAGVIVAWAKYGVALDRNVWDRLVRVSHWTAADVLRERALRERYRNVQADCVLERFGDILEYFEFGTVPDAKAGATI